MYAVTFIRMVEDEYTGLLNDCNALKQANGLDLFEKPTFICERVQKFRNWLTMAIRSAEITGNGVSLKAEDVLLDAAITKKQSPPYEPLHPRIGSVLTLYERTDLDGILGEKRRLSLEQGIQKEINECRFKVCYTHCQFIKSNLRRSSQDFSSDNEPSPIT
ncbi:hypothetical protein IX51_05865 [uncultured archaeon]|nr:hypothetical protein IX51_05865 [uncultured archaeon]